MDKRIAIIGGGLAGSEAALQLADRGFAVTLVEMRPEKPTAVHRSGNLAELVCSNSLKSLKEDSAAGMLKRELAVLGSHCLDAAMAHRVAAGGALAVDREKFSADITARVEGHPNISVERRQAQDIVAESRNADAVIVATGPLTSDDLAESIAAMTGAESLAFYDAAAPIIMADSLDSSIVFSQSRYEEEGEGDYLNAPFGKEEYERFIEALLGADRVIARDFESKDLFQACQPIEEVARSGADAPRFGALKPVGLTDPRTGRRPWAVVQLRREDAHGQSYNLVGFQTNLTFPEQRRVFRMIPGLERAEFARYGVMHRNTFIDAPRLLDETGRLRTPQVQTLDVPVYVAGQLAGTEGYCEAIRSGLHAALSCAAHLMGKAAPALPRETAYGALMGYASDPQTAQYQPMHVNFGIMEPLDPPVKNKRERYRAYAVRGARALEAYGLDLAAAGLVDGKALKARLAALSESEA